MFLVQARKSAIAATAAGLFLAGASVATSLRADEAPQIPATQNIDGLYYGEVLFHLYQQKYFFTLTDLLEAQKFHPIVYQGDEPDLLLAGLAVSYGLYDLADKTLQPLLAPDRPKKTLDIAWFYKSKLSYFRGDLKAAEEALTHIQDTLPEERQAERLNLLVDVYRAQGRLEDAVKVLDNFEGKSSWRYYALYNTGVSLIRHDRLDQGVDLLEEVGELEGTDEELKSLADRANLAIGYGYFSKGKGRKAVDFFKRVRLQGPFSNQALLGLGWAYTSEEDYQQALVPWFELRSRHTIDPTVQESLVAIPHVLERMQNPKLALVHYQNAIDKLEDALGNLEKVVFKTRSGDFLKVLRPDTIDDESDWPWDLSALPDIDAAPYLTQLLGTQEFQRSFEDYRTLLYFEFVLSRWKERLPAFRTAVETRKQVYERTDARVGKYQFEQKAARIEKHFSALKARLDSLDTSTRPMVLASADEQALIDKLGKLQRKISSENPPNANELLNRIRILQGQLRWHVIRDTAVRKWDTTVELNELSQDISQMNAVKTQLVGIRKRAPQTFREFGPRFNRLNSGLSSLSPRLSRAISRQEDRLQTLALQELAKRQKTLEQQVARARFSMVRLYDTLSNRQVVPETPADKTPTPSPPTEKQQP